ncbi:MAG: helix-turn-helix domain-containing protein [Tabrizicola sp.]|nr:helix-turn-helix domain-containing protein [Tabrizicola sp.]
MSAHNAPRPLVCLIAYDGLCAFEYGICLEVFGLPRPEFAHWYDLAIIAGEPGPLRSIGGLSVSAEDGLDRLMDADVVLVPGWRGVDSPVPRDLTEALCAVHARGARVASICSGAFVLAAAGLLDGRRATTHWRYANALSKACPQARIDPSILYTDDRGVMTSAGSAAGIDLCLHIVRQDFGVAVANAVARRLVLPAHRDGAQPQILAMPVPHEKGGRIAPLLDHMRARPDESWSVIRMAEVSGLSRRTFARRFKDATGRTPLVWLTQMRTDEARNILESTNMQVADVASSVGFHSVEAFRRAFRARHGISPSEAHHGGEHQDRWAVSN